MKKGSEINDPFLNCLGKILWKRLKSLFVMWKCLNLTFSSLIVVLVQMLWYQTWNTLLHSMIAWFKWWIVWRFDFKHGLLKYLIPRMNCLIIWFQEWIGWMFDFKHIRVLCNFRHGLLEFKVAFLWTKIPSKHRNRRYKCGIRNLGL